MINTSSGTSSSPPSSSAEAGYRAYSRAVDNKTHRGDPMPPWAALPEDTQRAWTRASERARAAHGVMGRDCFNAYTSVMARNYVGTAIPSWENLPANVQGGWDAFSSGAWVWAYGPKPRAT